MQRQHKLQDGQLQVEQGRVVDLQPSSRKALYTLYSEALQAVWTRFPTLEDGASTLCMLQPNGITTCTCEGGLLDTPVSGITSIWPCAAGLLLQDAGAAGVLLMDHPLNVPMPAVAYLSSHAQSHVGPVVMRGLTGWAGESVLWSTHLAPITVTLTRDSQHVAVWAVTRRCLQPDWLGNLPDLPVHTPLAGALGTPLPLTGGTDRLGPQGRFVPSLTPGITTTPIQPQALPTPTWPSALKKPSARTSTGMLSPAMFSTRPRHTQQPLASNLQRGEAAQVPLHAAGAAVHAGTGNATAAGSVLQASCVSLVRSSATEQAVFELVAEYTIPGVQPDSKCFPIRDADKQLLLAVLCPALQQVCLIPLTATNPSRSSTAPPPVPSVQLTARAAVLLSAPDTQPLLQPCPSYMLLLGPAGEVSLCWGAHPICNLTQMRHITHGSHGQTGDLQQQTVAAVDTQQAQTNERAHWELQPSYAYVPTTQVLRPEQGEVCAIPPAIDTLTSCTACSATVQLHTSVFQQAGQQEPHAGSKAAAAAGQQPEAEEGSGLTARVHVRPSNWICEQVLQLLQDVLDPRTCSLLLHALYHHAGFLSSDSKHSWSALVQVLTCALQPPVGTTAGPADPTHATSQTTGAAATAGTATPELFSSPGSTRFAALSLASPAVTRNLFSSEQAAKHPPAASGVESKVEVPSVAWQELAGQLSKLRGFNPQRYSSWSAVQGHAGTIHSGQADAATAVEMQQVSGAMPGLQGLLHTQGMQVLRQLHFLYEDFKLDVCRWGQAQQELGAALARWASALGSRAAAYWEHYACDLGPGWLEAAAPAPAHADNMAAEGGAAAGLEVPWDIFRILQDLAQGLPLTCSHQPPAHPLLRRTQDLLAVFSVLQGCATRCSSIYATACMAEASPHPRDLPPHHPTAALCPGAGDHDRLAEQLQKELYRGSSNLAVTMAQLAFTCQHLDSLPAGVALPLRDMLAHCRSSPPTGWPAAAYALVGREDIAATMSAASSTSEEDTTLSGASTGSSIPFPNLNAAARKMPSPGIVTPSLAMDCQPGTPTFTPQAMSMGLPSPVASLLQPSMARAEPTAPTARHAFRQLDPAAPVVGTKEHGSCKHSVAATWPTWSLAYQQRLHLPSHLQPLLAKHGNTRHGKHAGDSSRPAGTAGGRQGFAGLHAQALKDQAEWLQQAPGRINRLRFSQDDRLIVVSGLLSSGIPVPLQLDLPEADPELPVKQQQQLLAASLRTMALPVGRGALSLATAQPLPTEPLIIPPLCLSGLTGEQLTTQINLDLSTAQPAPGGGAAADITAWPEFHNGVAAGLRLIPACPRSTGGTPAGPASLHSSLVFQRPDAPTYTHAGLLLALGLTGHLSQLAWTDLYRYLSEQHDATTIGAMLGRAACYRGSMEVLTSKMLFLHLPSTHPSSFPELDMSPQVQSAALLGVGLLYQGTCHRQMAETMLNEIGRSRAAVAQPGQSGPGSVSAAVLPGTGGVSSDREAYALAAGFALGLITLGTGRQAMGLQDLNMEARLRWYLLGSSNTRQQGNRHMGPSKPSSLHIPAALNPVRYGVDLHAQLQGLNLGLSSASTLASQLQHLGGRELHPEAAVTASFLPQVVLEHSQPNLSVTSPAACMALALMFLKTHDPQVAAALTVPDTHTGLASVRPDLLALRVLARGLIMWDTVLPTQAWLDSQMTTVIKGDLPCMAAAAARQSFFTSSNLQQNNAQAVLLAHLAVLSGACLTLGLRYAGSANTDAATVLRGQLAALLRAKVFLPDATPVPGPGVVSVPGITQANAGMVADKAHVEACVCTVALALGLVMAGTGHLPTLNLLEGLGRRRHPSHGTVVTGLGITYGCHMALSMATGLLFLGAGSHSLTTRNDALAALLIAVYPHLPASPTDNRCHLQAFRHLYVLAAQPRCVEAVDVATHQPVYLPLTIHVQQNMAAGLTTSPASNLASSSGLPNSTYVQPWPQLQPFMTPGAASERNANSILPTANAADIGIERIAPCLLPEMNHVRAVSIHSSRYWPQTLTHSGQAGTGLQLTLRPCVAAPMGRSPHSTLHGNLHAKSECAAAQPPGSATVDKKKSSTQAEGQVVFVKKMAASLAYADDPSGIRSLLSQSYVGQGSLLGAGVNMQAADTAQRMGPLGTRAAQQASSQLGASHDITHLCATFSADPSVMGFAQALQELIQRLQAGQSSAQHGGWGPQHARQRWLRSLGSNSGSDGQGSVDGAAEFLHFCISALYECILGEKPEMMMVYVQLYTAAWQTKLLCERAVAAAKWSGPSNSLQHALAACNMRSLRAMWAYMPGPLVTACQLSKTAAGSGRSPASMLQHSFVEGLWALSRNTYQQASTTLAQQISSLGKYQATASAGRPLQLHKQVGRLPTLKELLAVAQGHSEAGTNLNEQQQQQLMVACEALRELFALHHACRTVSRTTSL